MLNKFYRRYWLEIIIECCAQVVIQWHVIGHYREVFEGTSQIPLLAIEYNQLTWAIFSTLISTVSVANGVRLWIREEGTSDWQAYVKPLVVSLLFLGFWIAMVYLLELWDGNLGNQPSNITIVPTSPYITA